MTMLQIDEKALETIIQSEVNKILMQKEEYINNTIFTSVQAHVKKQEVILQKITKYLEESFSTTSSPLISIIEYRVKLAVDKLLTDERNSFRDIVTDSLQKAVKGYMETPAILKGLIEPWLTKHIVENSEFIPYLQNKIENRLEDKIKSLNNILGENITMPIVKEFLTGYLSRRNFEGNS